MNKWKKEHKTLSFQFFINKSSIFVLFVLFFHLVYKIPNFNTWTAKHLVQASYTESTLLILEKFQRKLGTMMVEFDTLFVIQKTIVSKYHQVH